MQCPRHRARPTEYRLPHVEWTADRSSDSSSWAIRPIPQSQRILFGVFPSTKQKRTYRDTSRTFIRPKTQAQLALIFYLPGTLLFYGLGGGSKPIGANSPHLTQHTRYGVPDQRPGTSDPFPSRRFLRFCSSGSKDLHGGANLLVSASCSANHATTFASDASNIPRPQTNLSVGRARSATTVSAA